MTISIIIPAYNEENYLGKTLQSVFSSCAENLLEVIVVNNASTDATAEIAKSFKGVTVVNEPQKGLTKARQKGLDVARGDVVAYIDADTLVSPEWFAVLNREFEKDPKLICLSGPYYYYDLAQKHQWVVKFYYGILGKITYAITGYMVTGGNFAAKRAALQKIGGFDTTINFYGEDTDIARRLHEIGKVKFLGKFSVLTSGRRFSSEGLVATGARYVGNYASIVLTKKPLIKKYKDVR